MCFNPRSPFLGSDAWPATALAACIGMFQSTLPVSGERCSAHPLFSSEAGGFNPRSPFLGSDAASMRRTRYSSRVSIHAPRFWGAMPARRPGYPGLAHVSIHAPRFWGAMPGARKPGNHPALVSIHAPRFWGAMRRCCAMPGSTRKFQSTLPVSGERCSYAIKDWAANNMFQSTLPVSGERCFLVAMRRPRSALFQSTLPVSGERCLQRKLVLR